MLSKAELAEGGPVRGTMVIRPYGYSIWERMQAEVDQRIKSTGTENAYFPLFIPNEYLKKEKAHLEGFSPELAVVTHGGGKPLAEPIVVRPTSETIINALFSKWINSHRDLPLKINQWANVVRWELRPRLFLRTTEFLWQEGHTAHATEPEARDFAVQILNEVYQDFMEKVLLMPVFVGLKTDAEQFPGATSSLSCEAIMKDGKALQMGTSHTLGQSFSKMFDIKYLDKDGEHFVWQTSWGVSTRMMGGLIMVHGDDSGLCIPPDLAPVQVVLLVVRDNPEVLEATDKIMEALESVGIRVKRDNCEGNAFGRRSIDWEIKGVPLRIEIGPRDISENKVTLVRRDLAQSQDETPEGSAKISVPLENLEVQVQKELGLVSQRLWKNAEAFRNENTVKVTTIQEAQEAAESGFAIMPWDDLGQSGEVALQENGISVRCLIREDGNLPIDPSESNLQAIIARAY